MYNNYPSTSSYQNQTNDNNNQTNYDNSDLYEYDAENNKNPKTFISNATGRVKNLFSGDSGGDDHSEHQYKKDCLDSMCANINQTLIVPKSFYFFFFAAFGSLFPLMAIYFKQMAMSPVQVGILLGFRPFVEFLGAPFWASVGERFRKGRIIFLGSMLCWIGFTLAMGFIRPPVHSCTMLNETADVVLEKSRTAIKNAGINKRQVMFYNDEYTESTNENLFSNTFNDNNDFLLNEATLMRFKRQEAEEKFVIKNGVKYQIVTKIVPRNKTTTTKAATTITTISTTTTTTTTTTKRTRKKTTKEPVSNSVNRILDKVTSDIVKDSQTNEENKPKKEVEDSIKSVINDVTDDIANKKNEEISTSKRMKTSTTADDDDDDDLTAKTTGKPIKNEKSPYFGTPPSNIGKNLVKPKLKTSIVYDSGDVTRVFFVFLFLLLAGEFFCAPAITIADSCTLQYLGPSRVDLYGRQRMFGSLGWAIAMFSVGLLLDQSKAFNEHPCGQAGPDERNYTVCFAIYSVLMACAFVIATQFKFSYADNEQIPLKSMKQKAKHQMNKIRDPRFQHFDRQKFVNEDDDEGSEDYNVIDAEKPPARPPAPAVTIKPSSSNSGFVEINSSEFRKQKYKKLLDTCKSIKHLSFLFIIWFMGIGVGLVFTFLFWHLQDLGGSPALYGIASVINHMSELMAYFFVHQIVRKFGHVKILYAGLLGNFARFLYVALLTEPYWILPFEFIQGLTHALVWATATSYFAQSVPEELRSTAQGILQGLHFGLGRGCGAVIGGLIVNRFGTKVTFVSYGILCLIILIAYIAINRFTHDATMSTQPEYMQNQYATDDVNVVNSSSSYNNNAANNSFNNETNEYTSNPNAYYNNNQNASAFQPPILTPHGVSASNILWGKEFKNENNNNYY